MDFTPEEKAVVAQCLAEDPGMKRTMSLYWPYIIPLCAAAAYGFIDENYLISSASFFFLLWADSSSKCNFDQEMVRGEVR